MKFFLKILLPLLVLSVGCSKDNQPIDPIPDHQTFTIQSKHVDELRTINVWTPLEYKAGSDSFPVLYMPDGGIKEDFPHIANTLAELIKARKIPPIILVGIENTQRRRDLTGPTSVEEDKKVAPVVGGSEPFREFLTYELFPEIDKRYRTTNRRGIIGESLAGLFVTETFLLKPDLFDCYIAFDPSLWWNGKYLINSAQDRLESFPTTQKIFWFAGSNAEDISATVGQLAERLKTMDIKTVQWHYSDEANETHATIFRAAKEKAIVWAVNKMGE